MGGVSEVGGTAKKGDGRGIRLKGDRKEKGADGPKISSSGNFVASATSSPPKPQPISATVTALVIFFTGLASPCVSPTSVRNCSDSGSVIAGKNVDQSIAAGFLGLEAFV